MSKNKADVSIQPSEAGAIETLIAQFEDASQNDDGVEFWFAKDMQLF